MALSSIMFAPFSFLARRSGPCRPILLLCATMLYNDIKDIVLVMNKFGHKSITSIQIYVKLLQTKGEEKYVSKVATTLKEAQTLIKQGFE